MLDALVLRHLLFDLARIALAALLVTSCVPVGGWVRRVWGGRKEWLFDLGVGFGVVTALLRVLAALGLATRVGVLVVMGVVIVAGGAQTIWSIVRRKERDTPDRLPSTFFIAFPALLVASLFIALPAFVMALAPPASFDELAYHLRIPEVTLHTGWWPHDAANSATSYPSATEALYLPALAIDPSGVTARLVHFAFFVLLLIACGRVAFRLAGDERARLFAVLLIGSVPALGIAGGWALADAPLVFLLAGAALALLEGEHADAFALLGCAAAVKVSALLFGLPLALLAVRRDAWRGVAAGAVIALPWYITLPRLSGANLQWMAGQPRLAYLTRPEGLDNDLGGLLLIAMLVVVLLAFRRVELRMAASVAATTFALGMLFQPAGRVLLPAVVAVLLVAACMLARATWFGIALTGIFVVRGLAVVVGHNDLFFNPAPVAAGLESEETYLARNVPFASLYRRLADVLPPDANVLVVGEPRLFGFPARASSAGLPDPPALRPFIAAGGDLSQRLRAAGYTHILVALGPIHGKSVSAMHRRDTALTAGELHALDDLMRTLQAVARHDDLWLLRLVH